jgi:hypothetical protein
MPRPKRTARKRLLNELVIRKLKPEARAFLVWDTKQHGLALQVQPTGAKAWKAIYSHHGRPRWYAAPKSAAVGVTADIRAAPAGLEIRRI